MLEYERRFYEYQTQARGLLDRDRLRSEFTKLSKWYSSRLCGRLPENTDANCLDVPCGYGNFLFFLRAAGYSNIEGYDADVNQVKLARLLELPAHEGDAFDVLGDVEDKYDFISTIDFLEHIEKDEAVGFVDLCMRALKPGGVFVVRTCCADGVMGAHDIFNDITHRWGMTSDVLRHLLGMTGFDEVEILDERPQPYNAVNAVRAAMFPVVRSAMKCLLLCLGMMPPRVWSSSMWGIGRKPKGKGVELSA